MGRSRWFGPTPREREMVLEASGLLGAEGRAVYTGGSDTPIAQSDNYTLLSWTDLARGIELFDRTDPLNPLALTAGIYAVTANAYGRPSTGDSDTTVFCELDLDNDGYDGSVTVGAPIGSLAHGYSFGPSCTFWVPAGGKFKLYIANNDETQTIDANHYTSVQQLTRES